MLQSANEDQIDRIEKKLEFILLKHESLKSNIFQEKSEPQTHIQQNSYTSDKIIESYPINNNIETYNFSAPPLIVTSSHPEVSPKNCCCFSTNITKNCCKLSCSLNNCCTNQFIYSYECLWCYCCKCSCDYRYNNS